MKTKIASLIICAFMIVSIFAGCNLFETYYPNYLSKIVAEAGDVKITKEQLINGYYNYGGTLIEQGYSSEEALDEVIKLLIHRELLLSDIKAKGKAEVKSGMSQADYEYEITNEEYNNAIKDSWKFINDQLEEVSKELYGEKAEIFVKNEDEAKEPDFAPMAEYTPILSVSQNGDGVWEVHKYVAPVLPDDEDKENPEKLKVYDYVKPLFVTDTHATKIWNKYIENLKDSQKPKGYKNTSDKKTFERELDRVLKINIENAYLSKFESVYVSNFGFDKNGKILDSVQKTLINYVKNLYLQNKEEFGISPETYGSKITAVDGLGDYIYYGNSEQFFKVMHILVPFSDAQKEALSEIESNTYLSDDKKQELKEQIKSVHNTMVYERDEEGFRKTETTPVSVSDLDLMLKNEVANAKSSAGSSEQYQQLIVQRFTELIYKYNEDPGMINPNFEYVIGTVNSGMVEPFTNASRDLFDNGLGEKGAIWKDEETGFGWVETEYGYHFILYVDDISPMVQNVNDITIKRLNEIALKFTGGKTYLEFFFEKVAQSSYETYEAQVISGLESGLKYTFYKDAYKDLIS